MCARATGRVVVLRVKCVVLMSRVVSLLTTIVVLIVRIFGGVRELR